MHSFPNLDVIAVSALDDVQSGFGLTEITHRCLMNAPLVQDSISRIRIAIAQATKHCNELFPCITKSEIQKKTLLQYLFVARNYLRSIESLYPRRCLLDVLGISSYEYLDDLVKLVFNGAKLRYISDADWVDRKRNNTGSVEHLDLTTAEGAGLREHIVASMKKKKAEKIRDDSYPFWVFIAILFCFIFVVIISVLK